MSLLVGDQAAEADAGPERVTQPPALSDIAGTAAVTEVGNDLLMDEAYRVDRIMTNARFHRDEAVRDGMPDWMVALHQRAFEGSVAKLALLGVGVDDIPEAYLEFAGKTEDDLNPPAPKLASA